MAFKFFVIPESGNRYCARIFLLRQFNEDGFLLASYHDLVETMSKLSLWGGIDKQWEESFGECDGWEFGSAQLHHATLWLKDLGYKQVHRLEDLAE